MLAKYKKIFKKLDYVLLLSIVVILCIGFITLKSATVNASAKYNLNFVSRQMLWAAIGFIAFFLVLSIDCSFLSKWTKWMYALNLALLVAVLVFGKSVKGAQAWIPLGPIRFQPAELVKILMIICLARYLSERVGKLNTWGELLPVFIYLGIPLALILMQPDLGTGLVFVAILFGMMVVAGASLSKLFLLVTFGLGSIVFWIVGHYLWGWWIPLKEYQLMRLVVFINPEIDPRNWGWNIIQAKITVGSGGLWGRGWGQGPQTLNEFLPEQWTDFIFCVFAEEFGFIGAFVLLLFMFILLWRGIRIAGQAKDIFSSLTVVGIISMIAFHILQNIGMSIGIMPITGIPLPLMSYGGSSLLANMIALGLVMNIYIYREPILF